MLTKRKIRNLRKQAEQGKLQYYDVEKTSGLFGEFSHVNHGIVVLARHYSEAIVRARRRGYGRHLSFNDHRCTERFAHFRVKLHGKVDHWKNYTYY